MKIAILLDSEFGVNVVAAGNEPLEVIVLDNRNADDYEVWTLNTSTLGGEAFNTALEEEIERIRDSGYDQANMIKIADFITRKG